MSDDSRRKLLALLFAALPLGAQGQDPVDRILGLFDDPLQTSPVSNDIFLPGDDAPVPCPAKKDFSRPLALSEAADLALCNNPQIRSAWAEIRIQSAAKGEARAAYFPVISGSFNRMNDRTRYPGSNIQPTNLSSNTTYGLLSWRIFDFGARDANLQAADELLAAALDNRDAALQRILSAVVEAYFDAQTAKAVSRAKEKNEDIARSTLDAAKRRETKGVGSRSDTLQAATALAKAILERNRAKGAYRKTLSVLAYQMGAPADVTIILAEDLADHASENVEELKHWLEIAILHHPGIAAARAQLAAAEQKVVSVRSEGMPTIDFTGNYYRNGRPNQGLTPAHTEESTLGITITIPLFDGFSRTYKVKGAQAQKEQREADLRDAKNRIVLEVVKSYADASTALSDLDASESFLSAAQESLDGMQRRFDRGAADILELLSAQAALADAEQERVRSLAEWRSARFRLLASSGLLGRRSFQQ